MQIPITLCQFVEEGSALMMMCIKDFLCNWLELM